MSNFKDFSVEKTDPQNFGYDRYGEYEGPPRKREWDLSLFFDVVQKADDRYAEVPYAEPPIVS